MPAIINTSIVQKAKADARPGAKRYEVSDARAQGLVLRVGPSGAVWQFRFAVMGKDFRLKLGDVDTWSIAEARDIVGRGQAMLRDRTGIPDDKWIERLLVKSGKVAAATARPVAPDAKPRELFLWKLAEARIAYLADRAGVLRPVTVKDYKDKLTVSEIAEFDGTPVARITRQMMSSAVAAIHRSGRETHAENVVRAVTPFWNWLAADTQIEKSGVTPGVMHGLRAPDRSLREDEDEEDTYVPDLAEVARMIAIARSGALHPTIAAAVQLLGFTVQRRRTIVEARVDQFEPIENAGLWVIPPKSLKKHKRGGKRRPPHVIPLPPEVWKIVWEQAQRVNGSSVWLFPQIRARFAGRALKHVAVDTISHTLQFMPGIETTPHGIRRGFGTHGEELLGLLRADTDAILDHDTALITSSRAGRTDVTGVHYSLHNQTHRTWPIMRAWCDALEPLIEAEARKLPDAKLIKAAMAAARRKDDPGMAIAAE